MKQKKTKRLLIQIIAIFLPVLIIMVTVISIAMYNSTIDGFIKAQNSRMKLQMEEGYKYIREVAFLDEDAVDWIIDAWEANPDKVNGLIDTEEAVKLDAYMKEHPQDNVSLSEWLNDLPDDIRDIYIKNVYVDLPTMYEWYFKRADVDSIFLIDLAQPGKVVVLSEYMINGESKKLNDTYDYDLSQHPAIEQMLETGSDEIVYEKSGDIPEQGYFYNAYQPIFSHGKVRAAMGLSFNWDKIKSTATESLRNTLVISIGCIVVALAILLFVLYRVTVRPVRRLQAAIISYTGDKSSAELIKKMLEIKSGNELTYLADTISDLALEIDHYTNESVRQATERAEVEKELYEAKVSVMVSQVQPHFMYNALTSIAMLCTVDPETAQEATVMFADYLRGNMDSLKRTAPVPFTVELEHLKKYLYIEKLRFAHKLNIVYDIGPTDFDLPQLSIQPLVENAVKHGVGMKKKGGTVTISTRETEDAYEVCVSDDGVGFDPGEVSQKNDGRSHIGMENTKKRLAEMCDGEVIITSTVGEGTTARVVIPKNRTEEA